MKHFLNVFVTLEWTFLVKELSLFHRSLLLCYTAIFHITSSLIVVFVATVGLVEEGVQLPMSAHR